MKKIIIALTSLALVIFALNGCGGGAGSASKPRGENPGTPSVVQLTPSQVVAQTNSVITLHAKVLDGNGTPVSNRRVTFTDLSPIGVLSSTTAETNDSGIATVTLKSTTDGFATVQAEVNKDVGQARDRKTMVFSSFNTEQPPSPPAPILTLSVDDGDGIPNEPNDFILFKNANDNQRLITATVSQGLFLIVRSTVTFGADRAFKVGSDPKATCSDGSATCDVIFPAGNTALTNNSGEASVPVEVVPTALSSLETTLNITASADVGAFNLVTLFLEPVFVQSVTVSANPSSVASGGTSTITARALTNAGTPVPDGTTVNFTTTNGGVDPFAQTTNGIATAKYTAPTVSVASSATVTASVGGKSGSVNITITGPQPLSVTPSVPINGATGGTATFTVSGGTPAYTIASSNPAFPPVPASVNTSGGTFTVTVPSGTASQNVTYTIQDTKGLTAPATLTITTAAGAMIVAPSSATICENTAACSAGTTTATFTITGGTAPFTVTTDNNAVITSPVPVTGNTFTVGANINSISADTIVTFVTLTITDSAGTPATVTRKVTVINQT